MSGYLQRMAASAARPARAVHPLVGGLFAREPRPEPRLEPSEMELLVEPPREPSAWPHAMQAAQHPQPPQPRHWQVSNRVGAAYERAPEMQKEIEEEMVRSPRTQRVQASVGTPNAEFPPRVAREPLVAGWGELTAPERGAMEIAPEVRFESLEVREEREEASSAVVQPVKRVGLQPAWLTPSLRQPENAAPESASAVVRPFDTSRLAATPQPTRREEAHRGVEDIQIHIGRIEVIAIPQQPQRAAPAKTQRGETLEAYLKRHDRRSR